MGDSGRKRLRGTLVSEGTTILETEIGALPPTSPTVTKVLTADVGTIEAREYVEEIGTALRAGLPISLKALERAFPLETKVAQDYLEQNGVPPTLLDEYLNAPLETLGEYHSHLGDEFEQAAKVLSRHNDVLLYGDYDADGILGTLCLALTLERLGKRVQVFFPRKEEGYGFHPELVEKALGRATLVITVDCGASDLDKIAESPGKGELLIIDHHPWEGTGIPQRATVLDPNRPQGGPGGEPDSSLCGAGLATLFSLYLLKKEGISDPLLQNRLVALMGIATLADMMDCSDLDNHVALRYMESGFRSAMEQGAPEAAFLSELVLCPGGQRSPEPFERLDADAVRFLIAPPLSLGKRVETYFSPIADPNQIYAALRKGDCDFARRLAKEYVGIRERFVTPLWEKAVEALGSPQEAYRPVRLLVVRNAPSGVAGLLAQRLRQKNYCDIAVVACLDPVTGKYRGSVRSVYPIREVAKKVVGGGIGGHEYALGFSDLSRNELKELIAELEGFLARGEGIVGPPTPPSPTWQKGGFVATVPPGASLDILLPLLKRLSPWNAGISGSNWQPPAFILEDAQVMGVSEAPPRWPGGAVGKKVELHWGGTSFSVRLSEYRAHLVENEDVGRKGSVRIRLYDSNDPYLEHIDFSNWLLDLMG